MKEKTIIIEDKPKTLGDSYAPLGNNKNRDEFAIVVENKHPSFRIIEDFSAGNIGPEEEDQQGPKENVYYAEEIFDDEDDIYTNAMNDRLLQKEHHRTMFEIGETINNAVLANGFKTNVGLSLLASVQFSRLIYLPYRENVREFVKSLFTSISNPIYMTASSDGGQDDYLAYDDIIYRALEFARVNKNRPVFVFSDNLTSKNLFDYYHHFYQYIDNPDGDIYLTALGRSLYIPHNLYFIFTLQPKQCPFDIARRIYRYVSYLDFNFSEVAPSENKSNLTLSLEELRASLREAADNYGIKEDMWKKFDGIIELIHEVNGFVLQNKVARRLEDYAISYFTSPLEVTEVMDTVIANNFIHEAIITNKPQVYTTDYDLYKAIDNNFGPESLPMTRKVIKEYLDLFDKGGNRIDE